MKTLILTGLLAGGIIVHAADAPKVARKPNILVILTDDQRYDCIGAVNPRIHTPNIDRLANQGVLFNNAYIMGGNCAAVCTPQPRHTDVGAVLVPSAQGHHGGRQEGVWNPDGNNGGEAMITHQQRPHLF